MANVEELINIGFNLHQEGKLDDAENTYKEILDMDCENAEVYNLLGVLNLQKGNINDAIQYVEKAVEKSPQSYFYETLFQAYIRKGEFSKIVSKENEIIKLFPQDFSLLFNLGLAFKNLKNNKKAIYYYEKALEINPSSYNAWFNLSKVYLIEAEVKNAISALKICTKIKPHDKETEYFYSLALMRDKNYDKGLKYFESRESRDLVFALHNKSYPNKLRLDNRWQGENIKNKTLLVYYEAGFGDSIMFLRYLPLAKKRCKKLILIIQKPLSELIKQNKQLGVDTVIDSFIPESDIDFDVHASILSLPHILGLNSKNIFVSSDGYLKADSNEIENFRKKYFNNDQIKIGIKWRGNTFYDTDRVIPAEIFAPMKLLDGVQVYSLQTFEGSEETNKLPNIIDIGKDLITFSQTAAALSNIHLVICNDTSLAHLAGAMNIPCWIMLPYEVNWRWHTNLDVCDWYNSVRLFRQKSDGDWKSVFDKIMSEINHTLAEYKNSD